MILLIQHFHQQSKGTITMIYVCVLFYRVLFDYKKWHVTKSVMGYGYHPTYWPSWYWTPSLFRRPFYRSISVLLKISCKEKVSFCFIKGSNFDKVLSLKLRTWPATLWEEHMQREGGWLGWGEGMECGARGGRGGENCGVSETRWWGFMRGSESWPKFSSLGVSLLPILLILLFLQTYTDTQTFAGKHLHVWLFYTMTSYHKTNRGNVACNRQIIYIKATSN